MNDHLKTVIAGLVLLCLLALAASVLGAALGALLWELLR